MTGYAREQRRMWAECREINRANRAPRSVYFVQAGEGGPIKIGCSGNPAARMAEMQTGCPIELRLVGMRLGEVPDERALHARFAAHRIRGEWFRACAELVEEIRRDY